MLFYPYRRSRRARMGLSCGCSTGKTLAMLDGVFLGMAKALGLEPDAVAASILENSVAREANDSQRGNARKAGEGAPTCGLLRTAAGWQPSPDATADDAANAIAATAATAIADPRTYVGTSSSGSSTTTTTTGRARRDTRAYARRLAH
jgi:hypothetical protein